MLLLDLTFAVNNLSFFAWNYIIFNSHIGGSCFNSTQALTRTSDGYESNFSLRCAVSKRTGDAVQGQFDFKIRTFQANLCFDYFSSLPILGKKKNPLKTIAKQDTVYLNA